ncbi:hypothetical protein ACS0TY_016422 [Phlomoides rotata]
MKGLNLNASPENGRRNGVLGLGLVPGHVPATISIRVNHGHSQYEVAVPSNSNFGYIKSIISQYLGFKPETCKIIFGGVEKEDDEDLRVAGVMNNSEMLLEVMELEQKIPEEVQETNVLSKGEDAVADVRKEVDKLANKVYALQAIVDGGNRVDDKEIVYLSEMLMRQLLNLDGIEAEGEGRTQRKMEVRRVQSMVETLDMLKSRNRTSVSNTHKNLSEATQSSRAFSSGCQSVNTPSPMPSSSPYPVPHFAPSTPSHAPYYDPYQMPYLNPPHVQYYDPTQISNFTPSTHYPVIYYDPTQTSFYDPSTHSPVPYYYDPSHMTSSASFSVPPSSEVTPKWEHFN